MTTQTDYRVTNAIGKDIRTFSDPELAKAWAKARTGTSPGQLGELTVEEVTTTTTETRRRIYKPRPVQERRAA